MSHLCLAPSPPLPPSLPYWFLLRTPPPHATCTEILASAPVSSEHGLDQRERLFRRDPAQGAASPTRSQGTCHAAHQAAGKSRGHLAAGILQGQSLSVQFCTPRRAGVRQQRGPDHGSAGRHSRCHPGLQETETRWGSSAAGRFGLLTGDQPRQKTGACLSQAKKLASGTRPEGRSRSWSRTLPIPQGLTWVAPELPNRANIYDKVKSSLRVTIIYTLRQAPFQATPTAAPRMESFNSALPPLLGGIIVSTLDQMVDMPTCIARVVRKIYVHTQYTVARVTV